MSGLTDKQLNHLRGHKQYWWAALSTPASYVAWLTAAGCLVAVVARPGPVLAKVTIVLVVVAVAATVVKAIAVESLLSRSWSERKLVRPHRREVRRRQIYQASRRDGFIAVGRLIGAVAGNAID
jgi:tetrahydromethanopterin S-methyltransferase subunit E